MEQPREEELPPQLPADDGFWERERTNEAGRRNFFWLLIGAIAAVLFFGRGVDLFTPQ